MVQVQIHGGSVTGALAPETTHIVTDTGSHVAHASVKPLEVMQGVTSRLGGLQGLRLLRRLMVSGQLTLVAPRYAFHMTFLCTLLTPLYQPSFPTLCCKCLQHKTDLLACTKHSTCASCSDVVLQELCSCCVQSCIGGCACHSQCASAVGWRRACWLCNSGQQMLEEPTRQIML